jgi:hypothetical protein
MHKRLLLVSVSVSLSLLAGAVSACGGITATTGDPDGGPPASTGSAPLTGTIVVGSGTDAAGFGGPSAVSSSTHVAAVTINADGSTTPVAQARVAPGGEYSLDVPVHAGPTLVQALDASGAVVASAVLEDSLVAGKSVMVQPVTTESSVQAAVLLQMAATGRAVADIDLVELRARIDTATAAIVQAHAADPTTEATADIRAIATAMLVAQASRSASLSAAHVDAAAYAAAEQKAADALTAALNADPAGAAQARATFMQSVATLGTWLGMDAEASASVATSASASSQEAIASGSSSPELIAAFDVAQARLESLAVTAAATEAFAGAGASAVVMQRLQTASTTLVSRVGASTDAAALASAFDTWRASLHGPSGLVADVVGGVVTGAPSYSVMLSALTSIDATLQSSLATSATASASTSGEVDPTRLAGLVAQAYATFEANVRAAVVAVGPVMGGSDATFVTSVVVTSRASF